MFSLRLPMERYPFQKNVFIRVLFFRKNVFQFRYKTRKNVLYCFHLEEKVVTRMKRNAFSQLVTWKDTRFNCFI